MERHYYYLIAPVAFIVFFACLIASGLSNCSWDMWDNNMSDLGTSGGLSATLFNTGCNISGLLLSLYGVFKIICEKDLHRIAGIAIFVAGLGLFFLGFATADDKLLHDTFAGVLLIGAGTAMALASYSDIKNGYTVVKYSSLILFVVLLIQWPIFRGAVSEAMPILIASVWSTIQAIYHYKDLSDPSTP